MNSMKIDTRPNIPTQTLDTTITICDRMEMRQLIIELQTATTKSKRNGGAYSVVHQDGKKRVIFMIHLGER